MKKLLAPVCVMLAVLLVCLLPYKSQPIVAHEENLWTNNGQFGHPSATRELLTWQRTEFGIVWTWLVHDSCQSERTWHARIEPRYLLIYIVSASFAGLAMGFRSHRRDMNER